MTYKTFTWTIAVVMLVGASVAGVVWGQLATHQAKGYHQGMPLYVAEQVSDNSAELAKEIRALRVSIQGLREDLIKGGVQLTPQR